MAQGGRTVLGGVERADADAVLEIGGERVLGGGARCFCDARFAQHTFDEAVPLCAVGIREGCGQGEFGGLGGHGSRLGERPLAGAGAPAVTLHSLTRQKC
ncbi:hypothetical protein Srufu_011630 [Streptomyces libani subsp. rufus]|nr:hypothetical protein Srufu_011630 [Streptomyces libani subsp. rufus]